MGEQLTGWAQRVTARFHCTHGVLQGSILRPVLFNAPGQWGQPHVQGTFGQCSEKHGVNFGWFCEELDSMILAGPFQVGTYCDSMILRSDRKRLAEQQPPEPAEGAPAQRCAGNGAAPLRR